MSTATMIGRRIRLIFTDDRYTKLRSGDESTITDVTTLPKEMGGNRQIWIRWDNGSSLAMIEGKDQFEILEWRPEKKERVYILPSLKFDISLIESSKGSQKENLSFCSLYGVFNVSYFLFCKVEQDDILACI